jgi:hypothetical protein
MTKNDLQSLVVECLQEYFADQAPKLKENSMKIKKSELKALVNEVVRQCVKEAGPQYKVVTGKSQYERPGQVNRARQIQGEPEINEVTPPGGEDVVRALKKKSGVDNPWAVAWSMKNKGEIQQEEEVPGADEMGGEIGGDEHGEYDEQQEIRLLKAMGQAILTLLRMHKGMEEPEGGEEDGVPFKGPEGGEEEPAAPGGEPSGLPASGGEEGGEKKPPFPPKKKEAPEKKEPPKKKKDEKEVDESFKTQNRSFKTSKDAPQDPKNVRDPKNPMS